MVTMLRRMIRPVMYSNLNCTPQTAARHKPASSYHETYKRLKGLGIRSIDSKAKRNSMSSASSSLKHLNVCDILE